MKSMLWLLLILITTNGLCEIKIDYPNLSSAKPIIQERQKELYSLLRQKKNLSIAPYELAESYGLLGEFYHAHDYLDVAVQLYINAVALAPVNSKWHYLLGMSYRSLGEFALARKSFANALKENDGYYPTMIYLAAMLMQEGSLEEAKSHYQSILIKKPNYAQALVGLGQVEMQLGQAESAITHYKKALTIQPSANHVNFLLSQAYASLGKVQEAEKFNKLKGKIQVQMYDPLLLAMLEESRSSSYYNDKAVRAYYAKNYGFAESMAKKAISYDVTSPYSYVTLANIYVSSNRAQQASEVLEKIIAGNEQDPNLKYSLGVVEEIIGEDKKAIYWYQKTLELNPRHKQASITLPSALMRQGQYDQALVALKQASEIDPTNSFIIQRTASIHAHKKQCQPAVKEIYQAVKSQPKNFVFLLTFFKIAVACNVSKQVTTDALNAARNMYKISQDNSIVETLAMIEAKEGHFQEAIDYQAQLIYQYVTDKKLSQSKRLKEFRANLKLYQTKKFPTNLFERNDIDLNPQRIQKVK